MLHPRSKGRTDKTCCFNTPHPKPQRQLRLTLPRHIFHLAPESSFYTRRAFQTSREGSYIPKSCPLPFKPLARPWRSGHTWPLLATQKEALPFLQLCKSPAPSHGSNSSPLTAVTARGKFPTGSRNLPFQEQLESLPGMHKHGSRQNRRILPLDLGDQRVQMTKKVSVWRGENTYSFYLSIMKLHLKSQARWIQEKLPSLPAKLSSPTCNENIAEIQTQKMHLTLCKVKQIWNCTLLRLWNTLLSYSSP